MAWTTTQPTLIAKLRDADDQVAWRRFDRLYGKLIVGYARRRGLSLADAEDVRQIVSLSLVRAMPSFELQPSRGKFRSYLGRVVGNAIERYRRRPHRRLEVLEEDEVLARAPGTGDSGLDAAWQREWEDHHLRRALEAVEGELDGRSLAIFERLLAGARPATVAAEMQMSVQAVYKVKQRARDKLRARIALQVADESTP